MDERSMPPGATLRDFMAECMKASGADPMTPQHEAVMFSVASAWSDRRVRVALHEHQEQIRELLGVNGR